jgi:hypothetical protein
MPTRFIVAAAALVLSGGQAFAQAREHVRSHSEVAAAISETMRQHHFDPASLSDPAYQAVEARIFELATQDQTDEEFAAEFNALWRNGPFSHVVLQVSESDAETTAAYLDSLRVGGEGARLTWQGDTAILTVTTMMGLDTIEQIDAAYAEIEAHGARALIIDLRGNEGGAFAVRPLVGHVIRDPLEAGVFVSQPWAAEMDRAPTRADAQGVEPWVGWSVTAFWRDVEVNRLTRVQFASVAPTFDGRVFVLTSGHTASAAELAADALQASGRAVLIGEPTAGRMLSQKPYDLPMGFQLYLPIADYYAFHSGRIEGRGVTPDVQTDADAAMGVALERARLE